MKVDQRLLRERIEALSDEELIQMLADEPHQYIPEALAYAEEECAKRKLSLDTTNGNSKGMPVRPGILESIEAGVKAAKEAMEPGIYRAADIKVTCPICHSDRFESQSVLLNTRALTFFRLDWLNTAATTLVCANCGLIQWFKKAPERES